MQDLREIPATACFQQHHLYFRADPGGYDVGFQQDTTAVAPFETLLSQVSMIFRGLSLCVMFIIFPIE